jgi:TPR repeat protein
MKFTLKHTLAVIILMLSLASPVFAGPFEDAVMAYGRGDYATALQLFHPLADQGNAIAQYNLGVMYYDGKGVAKDDAEAMKWYCLAADQCSADAQYYVGLMYKDGAGVPRDYVRAHMWFNLSAVHGYQEAGKGRDFCELHKTPEQISEAQKLAREWKATTQPAR